jgi:hypothetical protein
MKKIEFVTNRDKFSGVRHLIRSRVLFLVSTMLWITIWSGAISAKPRKIDDFHWENVDTIVAIGDLHGDYDNYIATLRAAGLINAKGKWSAGETHFVQTGDIPDRGPDTLKIIEHIDGLRKQAKRKGGRVHSLIGNHEAMNVYGDVRYVHAGEFAAFETRNSAALRDRYYGLYMQNFEAQDPAAFALLPENHREEWDKTHLLGWLEHRQAWDLAWNPKAKYAKWVLDKPVVIQVNDNIFLHGGISEKYATSSFEELTKQVWAGAAKYNHAEPGVVEDELGPLWYRGLAGMEPRATAETVQSILDHHKASRIVVGHTVTSGVIWPSYEGRVIQIDTGISAYYGGHVGYLKITADGATGGYTDYELKLPESDDGRIEYLEQVIARDPDNRILQNMLDRLVNPPVEPPLEDQPEDVSGAENQQ